MFYARPMSPNGMPRPSSCPQWRKPYGSSSPNEYATLRQRMSPFGTKRNCQDVRYLAAFGGKPDIERTAPKDPSNPTVERAGCYHSKTVIP